MKSPLLEFSTKQIKKIESTVLILPTLSILRCFKKALGQKNILKQAQVVADAIPLYHIEGLSILSPCLGCGAISTALPPLLNKGASKVVLIGFVGALPNRELTVSDIVSANGFFSNNEIYKSQLNDFHSKLKVDLKIEKKASVFTTDYPYCETKESIAKISNKASLIEMEALAAHNVCKDFDAEFSAHFVISDVWGKDWNNNIGSKSTIEVLENLFSLFLNSKSIFK